MVLSNPFSTYSQAVGLGLEPGSVGFKGGWGPSTRAEQATERIRITSQKISCLLTDSMPRPGRDEGGRSTIFFQGAFSRANFLT